MEDKIFDALKDALIGRTDLEKIEILERVKSYITELHPLASQPVNNVRWVPIEKVCPNDYNPNSVATVEMRLLYVSIKNDGYTQPIVTVYDKDRDMYVIVDGFHRYFTCKSNPDIYERNKGRVPIVVIEKDINDRMASTVRHNRARGKHNVGGMASMVFDMLKQGWSDADICNNLGMEPEEIVRLKHITGFSKLFENAEFRRAWETEHQVKLRQQFNVR